MLRELSRTLTQTVVPLVNPLRSELGRVPTVFVEELWNHEWRIVDDPSIMESRVQESAVRGISLRRLVWVGAACTVSVVVGHVEGYWRSRRTRDDADG